MCSTEVARYLTLKTMSVGEYLVAGFTFLMTYPDIGIDNHDSGYLGMGRSSSMYKLIWAITISWPRRNTAKN